MKIFAETERLILRELLPTDDKGMFELDSDENVHTYLGNKPVTTIAESQKMIAFIRHQYVENGIGRWAVEEKKTGEVLGWAGLKLITEETNGHINFYDIGYRLIKKYWGKGFATEAAKASVDYGFEQLKLNKIYAMAHADNAASQKILKKIGLKFVEKFNFKGVPHVWLEMEKPVMHHDK